MDLKNARIKGGRVVIPCNDGSTISLAGNQAWRHVGGRTENIPIESVGYNEVRLSHVGGGAARATLHSTDGRATDITLRYDGGPSIVEHLGSSSTRK